MIYIGLCVDLSSLEGRGGDTGDGQNGVTLNGSSKVGVGTTGNTTVKGIGGNTSGYASHGILAYNSSEILSNGGTVLVEGTGGGIGPTSGDNYGIMLWIGGKIFNTGTGAGATVTVKGQGGNPTGSNGGYNYGVFVKDPTSWITASGGPVLIEGTGGGSGESAFNYGIRIDNGAKITNAGTTPASTVTAKGTGGNTGGTNGAANHGVWVGFAGSEITSSFGAVNVEGRGGGCGNGGNNWGIEIVDGKITSAGTGPGSTVTVKGWGGNLTGTNSGGNYGIFPHDNAEISSSVGNLLVEGYGGGNGNSNDNHGLALGNTSRIASGGSGTNTVKGKGGNSAGTFGHSNIGVLVGGTSAEITSAGGAVLVEGTGGGSGTGNNNRGVFVVSGSKITSSGAAALVSVKGWGGNTTGNGNGNDAVFVEGSGAEITSGGGDVDIEGTGGGAGTGIHNLGVFVLSGGKISSSGVGTVTVDGKGGNLTGDGRGNWGVHLNNSVITSTGGPVFVDGTGGGANTSGENYGILLSNSAQISNSGTGAGATVTVKGIAGNLTGNSSGNYGILMQSSGTEITSTGGNVLVEGTGGGNGFSYNNLGVSVESGAKITSAGTSAAVSVKGRGGNLTGTDGLGSHGVVVVQAGSEITSSGGPVLVDGLGGGNLAAGINFGVNVSDGGRISNAGIGPGSTVTVLGQGGNPSGTGGGNHGVVVSSTNSTITSSGGGIFVTGISGGTSSTAIVVDSDGQITGLTGTPIVTVTGDSMAFSSVPSVNAGTNTVNLSTRTAGTLIDLGGSDVLSGSPLTLGLFDDELDRVTAGTLNIGKIDSGTLTTTADITRPAATNMSLVSGGDVIINGGQVNTGGGTLLLDPGNSPAAVKPTKSATDATASTVSFGSDLSIVINGTAVDTGYNQLNVVGAVNLTGVSLVTSGSYIPVSGDWFTIVENDGTDPIIGTFTGLSEGATIANFLGSGLNAKISYIAGDGNDAVLTVGTVAAITFAINDVVATEGDSGTTNYNFTITKTGTNGSASTVNFMTQDGTATSRQC